MARLFNRPQQLRFRRDLRSQLTHAEAVLWTHLKGSRLDGAKFRRQQGVGVYVLDFYCPAVRLAIELDGAAHDHEDAVARDAAREAWLAAHGIRVIRFVNDDVLRNPEGVLAAIRDALESARATTPARAR